MTSTPFTCPYCNEPYNIDLSPACDCMEKLDEINQIANEIEREKDKYEHEIEQEVA